MREKTDHDMSTLKLISTRLFQRNIALEAHLIVTVISSLPRSLFSHTIVSQYRRRFGSGLRLSFYSLLRISWTCNR